MGIARKLQAWLDLNGWTAATAASRWGVKRSTLYRVLESDRAPTAANLAKIAGGMGLTVEALLSDDDPPAPVEPTREEAFAQELFRQVVREAGTKAAIRALLDAMRRAESGDNL